MPELQEQMYCSQQIVIPPKFPYIIKKFAKAAIKTQPYDLLRWACEYFTASAHGRTPPVKLRLEYPIYSSSGGLTRGYLRVLYQQLKGEALLYRPTLERRWRGACLDPLELARILCLCDAWRPTVDSVATLVFFAVAGGYLTQSLTQTMILMCETLTVEPEGGSAAISVEDFLVMYRHLAALDASADVNYINGIREGHEPPAEEEEMEEESVSSESVTVAEKSSDDFFQDAGSGRRLTVTGESYVPPTRLSEHLSRRATSVVVQRTPSLEREAAVERAEHMQRRERGASDGSIDRQLREMSSRMIGDKSTADLDEEGRAKQEEEKRAPDNKNVQIVITDEDDNEIPLVIYGQEFFKDPCDFDQEEELDVNEEDEADTTPTTAEIVAQIVEEYRENRARRIEDVENALAELAVIVNRWKYLNYDLGMIAGRQMSTGSGEFIAQSIERDIMDVINEQIAILPDPDLKKKKAKPEEVAMVRALLEAHVADNMEVIVPEQEVEEEEEEEAPEVVVVYAVPGIGAPVPRPLAEALEAHARAVAAVQRGLFMPRNIRHFLCPPLEEYADPLDEQREGLLAPGGVITE